MALADLGSLGLNGNKTAGNSLAIVAAQAADVGDVVIVQVATDNAANVNTATSTHTGLTCGSNVFTKVGEQTRGGGGVAGGVTLSVWRCELTQAIAAGAAITAGFNFSPIAKGMSARRIGRAQGSTLSYAAPIASNNTGAPALATISGLDASKEHFLFRSGAAETKVASFSAPTSGWTLGSDVGSTGGGGDATHVSVMNETIIGAGSSFSSQPTGNSFDRATIMLAITETLAAQPARTATGSPVLGVFLAVAAADALVRGIGAGALNAFTVAAALTVSEPAIHATAAPNLGAFVTVSAAKAAVEGIGFGSFNALTATGALSVTSAPAQATATPVLAPFTAASIVRAKARASASPAIGPFLSAAASRALLEGLGSSALSAFGSAGAASLRVRASASPVLASLAAEIAATARLSAAGAPSLATLTGDGVIEAVTPSALLQGSPALGAFAAESAIAARVKAVAAPPLGTFLSEAASEALVEGLGSGQINPFGSAAAGGVRVSATGSPEIGPFTCSATAAPWVRARASVSFDPLLAADAIGGSQEHRIIGSPVLNSFDSTAESFVRIAATVDVRPQVFTAALVHIALPVPGQRRVIGLRKPRVARGRLPRRTPV